MKQNRIAVTGGIGSGKSEVMQILKELGYAVIKTDDITKEVLMMPEAVKKIAAAFGDEFIDSESGAVNSRKLGGFVFADVKRVKVLNGITHPLIARELKRQIRRAGRIVFVEIPLLIETGAQKRFSRVWLVTAPEKLRTERLKARGMSEEQIRQRMEKQLPDEIKSKFAHNIIVNDGTAGDLKAKVAACLETIKND